MNSADENEELRNKLRRVCDDIRSLKAKFHALRESAEFLINEERHFRKMLNDRNQKLEEIENKLQVLKRSQRIENNDSTPAKKIKQESLKEEETV